MGDGVFQHFHAGSLFCLLWLLRLCLLRFQSLQHLSLGSEGHSGQFATMAVVSSLLSVVVTAVSVKSASVGEGGRWNKEK